MRYFAGLCCFLNRCDVWLDAYFSIHCICCTQILKSVHSLWGLLFRFQITAAGLLLGHTNRNDVLGHKSRTVALVHTITRIVHFQVIPAVRQGHSSKMYHLQLQKNKYQPTGEGALALDSYSLQRLMVTQYRKDSLIMRQKHKRVGLCHLRRVRRVTKREMYPCQQLYLN